MEIFVIKKWLPDSASRRLSDSASRGVADSPTLPVKESAFECLKENSASRGVAMVSRGVPMVSQGVAIQIFKNFDFPNFKRLNQLFNRSIWQKEAKDVMYYYHWFI